MTEQVPDKLIDCIRFSGSKGASEIYELVKLLKKVEISGVVEHQTCATS